MWNLLPKWTTTQAEWNKIGKKNAKPGGTIVWEIQERWIGFVILCAHSGLGLAHT